MARQQLAEQGADGHRLAENCSYTAVAFTIWLRWLRRLRTLCAVLPILFGAVATWKFLEGAPILGAVSTLLATVIPPAYRAWKVDREIDDYTMMAGEFTNLRDRFRQAALVGSTRTFAEFDTEMRELVNRLDKARQKPLTPPEWCFKSARKKIKAGGYSHDYGTTP